MTWSQFNTELQKKHILPIYFFYGDEPYLLDEALKSLSNAIVDKNLKDFNLNTFYASEVSVLQIKEAIKTMPVMSNKRVVILKDVCSFKSINQLQSLIEKPVSSCILVFTDSKINQRMKFFKILSQTGAIVKCSALKDYQLVSWIQKIVSDQQKSIDKKACEFLLQRVGSSMLDLNNEITKLMQYIGESPSITIEHIKQVVSKQYTESVFDLVNALGSPKSLLLLKSLIYQGQSEILILTMLARQIRILILVKEAQLENLSSTQICQKVGISSYFLNSYIHQSRSWSFTQLYKFHTLLLETDRLLKSTSISKSLLIESCLLKAFQIRDHHHYR